MKDFKVNLKTIFEGHHKTQYRGVDYIKCPFDYVIYQMIIFDVKPDLVIEIGANKGGGALYIADLMDIIGNGVVHTIDINDKVEKIVNDHKRIKCFFDGYEKYDLALTKNFEKIMVIEDASHNYSDSINCLNKFAGIVSKGSYYIVEDGIVDKLGMRKKYQGGPKKAIKEFLKKTTDFEVDLKWCNMFGVNASFNINGYLKRI